MNWRCRIGWHRWHYEDEQEGSWVVTWAWCMRPECKYAAPRRVNIEQSAFPHEPLCICPRCVAERKYQPTEEDE